MKWALVVYFMTTAGWQSAESLGKDKIGCLVLYMKAINNALLELECLMMILNIETK